MKKILVLASVVLSLAALLPAAVSAGEAYVAIADDATATHWNPAGLGTHPLSPSWMNAPLPGSHGPLKAMAALRTGKGNDYTAFDIWAISSAGLIRYNNKKWESGETFTTRSDDTIEKRARAYYNVTDDAALKEIIDRVADFAVRDDLVEYLLRLVCRSSVRGRPRAAVCRGVPGNLR